MAALLVAAVVQAGSSITIAPLTSGGNNVSVASGATATVNYKITNNIPGGPGNQPQWTWNNKSGYLSRVNSGGSGGIPDCGGTTFTQTQGSSCVFAIQVNGAAFTASNQQVPASTPNFTSGMVNNGPSQNNQLSVTLASNPSNPTSLSVAATGIIPVNGGTVNLLVTNNGAYPAINVRADLTGFGWSGVTQTPCATIAAGGSCNLTFSSTIPYIARGSIAIVGDNISNTPTTALAFSTGGYLIYSVSGSGPSYAVKVVDNVDAADMPPAGSIWSSNGTANTSANAANNTILGIDELSSAPPGAASPTTPAYPGTPPTPAYTGCNGKSDGSCNSTNILNYYNTYINSPTLGTTPLTFYAAGICYSSTAGSSSPGSWYLPSICELGVYDANIGGNNAVVGLITLIYIPIYLNWVFCRIWLLAVERHIQAATGVLPSSRAIRRSSRGTRTSVPAAASRASALRAIS